MKRAFSCAPTRAAAAFVLLASAGCSPHARTERALTLGGQYQGAGDYDRAEIEYKNVLQREPLNAAAIAALGAIYHEQGRDLRAVPYLLRAREVDAANHDNRVRLGVALLAMGKRAEARAEAIFVLQQEPTHAQAPVLLGDATSADAAEVEDSRRHLLALPSPASERAPVLVALGLLELRQGRTREAGEFFTRARTADPKSADAAEAIGWLHWTLKDVAAADAALREAAELTGPRSLKRLKYAQFKLETEGVAAARPILQDMTRRAPDFVSPWIWLADLASREKNYAEADALLARVFAREPQHPPALLLQAQTHLAKREPARAISDLETLHTIFPQSPEVIYHLGMAHAAQGDPGKAAAWLNQAVAAAPGMAPAVLALAELNIRRHDYPPAIAALKKLALDRPDLPAARGLLADAHRRQGNLEEALVLYRGLEEQFPANPQAPFWRGMVLLKQGHHDEARTAFERVRERDPAHIGAFEQLVELDLRTRDFAAAKRRLEQEIARDGSRAEPRLLLAKTMLLAGDRAAADAALRQAGEVQPASPFPHFTLARLQFAAGELDAALASVQIAATRDANHPGIHLLMGMIQEGRRQHAAARDAYEKALALDPKNATALNNLACLYADHLGRLDRALELAQAARDLLPNSPEMADTLGWILYRRAQYSRALALLEPAAAALRDSAEVQYHLGMAHYMLGQEEPARRALGRALELSPTFPAAADARDSLSVLNLEPSSTSPQAAPMVAVLERRKDDPIALARMAAAYERQSDWAGAIAAHEKILAASPGNVPAAVQLVRLHRRNGNLPRALELAKAARKHAPSDAQVAHALGRAAFESGDHAWAVSLLQEASRKQAADPELLFDLAEASYSVGQVSAAETAAREALEVNAGFSRASEARRFLELVAFSANPASRVASASKIEEALQADPANVPALMAKAAAAEEKRDADTAKRLYEKALARFPEFTPAQKRLAILYAAQPGNDTNAIELATKARKAFPSDAEVAKAIGILMFRQANYTRAASLLQESAGKRRDDGELMYYIGMTQLQLNKRAESKRALERALELGLEGSLAAEARKNLGGSQ